MRAQPGDAGAVLEDVRSRIRARLRDVRSGGRSLSRQQLTVLRRDAGRIYELVDELRARGELGETLVGEGLLDDVAGSVDGLVDTVERLEVILGAYNQARRRRRQPGSREPLRALDDDHAVYVERNREVIAGLEALDAALRMLATEA
jgi:hypothetical protein